MRMVADGFPKALGAGIDGLKECIRAFERTLPVERVVLFGSHARGQNTPNSDVDLCIVIHGLTSQRDAARSLRKAIGLIRNKPALSLIPISPERLKEKRRIHDPFYEMVMEEGICLAEED